MTHDHRLGAEETVMLKTYETNRRLLVSSVFNKIGTKVGQARVSFQIVVTYIIMYSNFSQYVFRGDLEFKPMTLPATWNMSW